jgi:hypothetical protein
MKWIFVFCAALAASLQAEPLLPEGFVINGIDGRAVQRESSGEDWSFVPSVELTYMKTVIAKGTPLPILPSIGQGQMRSIAGDKTEIPVRIWGILTQYRKQNYLFPIQVLPLTVSTPTPVESKPSPSADAVRTDPNVDPNTEDVMPAELLKILRSQQRIDLARLSEAAASREMPTDQEATATPDGRESSLIGKAGFITLGETKYFMPDAFGRKVEKTDFILLPCLTLETVEERLSRGLGRYRYTISGIMTQYQGKNYLLLYRAIRTYSNHNFTP